MRSSSPLISIHLINYNCQPFLKQAVESALQQSLTDFELIIADDGSQDESQNLIKSFRDPRIRTFLNAHLGLEKSRQWVLNHSRGKWTAIFDADDISKANRLEILLKLALETQAVIVGGQIEEIDENGAYLSSPKLYSLDEEEIRERLGKKYSVCHGASIYLTDLARAVGGYWVQTNGLGEDEDLFVRMSKKGRVANSEKVVVQRRIRRDSVCNHFQSRVVSIFPPGQEAALDSIYWARVAKSYFRGNEYRLAKNAFQKSLQAHWGNLGAYWGLLLIIFKKVSNKFRKGA